MPGRNVSVPCRNANTCGGLVHLRLVDERRFGAGKTVFPEDRILSQTCRCDLSSPDEVARLVEERGLRKK